VDNVTDNPSNHLYHRFDRESKHPKKRKFVYFDPNEPKKLFGIKTKKVNKKEDRSSVSPSQSPSARNKSPPKVVTAFVSEMNITKSRNDSPHKATTTTTSSLVRSGKHFFSDAQEEEARLYYVEVKERH
jgi:hypothetical protein